MIRRREFLISAGVGVGALALGPARWQRALAAAAEAQTGSRTVRAAARSRRQRRSPARRLQLAGDRAWRRPGRPCAPIRSRSSPTARRPSRRPTAAGSSRSTRRSREPAAPPRSVSHRLGRSPTPTRSSAEPRPTAPAGARPGARGSRARRSSRASSGNATRPARPAGVRRDALGRFKHEAACVDPIEGRVYLTEDLGDGGLYRFTPGAYPDLSTGCSRSPRSRDDNSVSWTAVPNPTPTADETPTRQQVAGIDAVRPRRGHLVRRGRSSTWQRRATRRSTPTTSPRGRSRSSTAAPTPPTRRCRASTTSPSRARATSSSARTPTTTTPTRWTSASSAARARSRGSRS